MKRTLAALCFFVLSTNLFAIYDPKWERPVLRAEMNKGEATGFFTVVSNPRVTLTKRDGSKNFTGIYLVYELASICHGNSPDCPPSVFETHFLKITKIKKYDGFVEYSAKNVTIPNCHYKVWPYEKETYEIILRDYGSNCPNEFRWEAMVGYKSTIKGSLTMSISTMKLVGNPVEVVTKQ